MYGPVPVKFGWKRHVWDTPCIAGVSSCSSSLMSRSILWPEYAMIFGTGHSHKRLRPHLHIILHVYNSNFKQSIRFLATITMKRRLHSCRIVNMQKYVGAVRHRGLALRVAAIWIFDVFRVWQFGESRNILIRTFYKERIMLAQLYILSI
jgi:hypothetical protein